MHRVKHRDSRAGYAQASLPQPLCVFRCQRYLQEMQVSPGLDQASHPPSVKTANRPLRRRLRERTEGIIYRARLG